MITFKDFLDEGVNDHFLYHGTTIDMFKKILKDNALKPVTVQFPEVFHATHNEYKNKYITTPEFHGHTGTRKKHYAGISLTRDIKFAWKYAEGKANKAWEEPSVILQFDHRKLRNRLKIMPISYWGGKTGIDAEYEEFVVGGIPNMSSYLTAIIVPQDLLQPHYFADFVKQVIKQSSITGSNHLTDLVQEKKFK
jgi:hypothetical protein